MLVFTMFVLNITQWTGK